MANELLGGGLFDEDLFAKKVAPVEKEKLPSGWRYDSETQLYVEIKTGATRADRPYDKCGTFGCILEDRHPGLHVMADSGIRSRKRVCEVAYTPPEPIAFSKPTGSRKAAGRDKAAGRGKAAGGRSGGATSTAARAAKPKPKPKPKAKGDEIFQVREIKEAHEESPGAWKFLISWVGYSDAWDSWEPEPNLLPDYRNEVDRAKRDGRAKACSPDSAARRTGSSPEAAAVTKDGVEDMVGYPGKTDSQCDQCERDPLCVRGFRHGGKGGRCSYAPVPARKRPKKTPAALPDAAAAAEPTKAWQPDDDDDDDDDGEGSDDDDDVEAEDDEDEEENASLALRKPAVAAAAAAKRKSPAAAASWRRAPQPEANVKPGGPEKSAAATATRNDARADDSVPVHALGAGKTPVAGSLNQISRSSSDGGSKGKGKSNASGAVEAANAPVASRNASASKGTVPPPPVAARDASASSAAAAPNRAATPPLPASSFGATPGASSGGGGGGGDGGVGGRSSLLLLDASLDLQIELLGALHVRRTQLEQWRARPEWLPGGPRGLLVKVKAAKGAGANSDYVVAEIIASNAQGQLSLKATDGALTKVPGAPCWYPYEYVSNEEFRRDELIIAALNVQQGVFSPITCDEARSLAQKVDNLNLLAQLPYRSAASAPGPAASVPVPAGPTAPVVPGPQALLGDGRAGGGAGEGGRGGGGCGGIGMGSARMSGPPSDVVPGGGGWGLMDGLQHMPRSLGGLGMSHGMSTPAPVDPRVAGTAPTAASLLQSGSLRSTAMPLASTPATVGPVPQTHSLSGGSRDERDERPPARDRYTDERGLHVWRRPPDRRDDRDDRGRDRYDSHRSRDERDRHDGRPRDRYSDGYDRFGRSSGDYRGGRDRSPPRRRSRSPGDFRGGGRSRSRSPPRRSPPRQGRGQPPPQPVAPPQPQAPGWGDWRSAAGWPANDATMAAAAAAGGWGASPASAGGAWTMSTGPLPPPHHDLASNDMSARLGVRSSVVPPGFRPGAPQQPHATQQPPQPRPVSHEGARDWRLPPTSAVGAAAPAPSISPRDDPDALARRKDAFAQARAAAAAKDAAAKEAVAQASMAASSINAEAAEQFLATMAPRDPRRGGGSVVMPPASYLAGSTPNTSDGSTASSVATAPAESTPGAPPGLAELLRGHLFPS